MAVGYFSRAVRRASPAALRVSQARIQPAAPIASPLTEEDQRLNLVDGAVSESGPAVSMPDRGAPDAKEPEAPGPMQARGKVAPADADHTPDAPCAPGNLGARSEPQDYKPSRGAPEARHPPDLSEPTTATQRPLVPGDEADYSAVDEALPAPSQGPRGHASFDETAPPERPSRRPPTPASPMTETMRVLAAAERWVAEEPEPEIGSTSEAHQTLAPSQRHGSGEIVPVLPRSAEPARQATSAPPQVVIDNIEVEIVAPPAAAQPRMAPRRAPAKAPSKPAMPFGWRQR
jgi:hypothetical protein